MRTSCSEPRGSSVSTCMMKRPMGSRPKGIPLACRDSPMDSLRAEIESKMCAVLRGEEVSFEHLSTPESTRRFQELAVYHGLGPLLSMRLKEARSSDGEDLASPFPLQLVTDIAAIELVRTRELNRVLDGLSGSGIEALVLKGAALAHSLYPSPPMRPRADADLLIPADRRETVDRSLAELGYEKCNSVTGKLVSYQHGYVHCDRFGIEHVLDIHWRISNSQQFSRVLDYETLEKRSLSVPALGKHARALAMSDALLLACMHRIHHLHRPFRIGGLSTRGVDRLIWIYDIHLLLEAMSYDELLAFARMSEQNRMLAVSRDGVMNAVRYFGTRVPERLLDALRSSTSGDDSERYLQTGRSRAFSNELSSLPRWRDRLSLLGEHLFPPVEYMLAKYSVRNRAWLPILYVQRGIHGTWKRLLGC